LRFGRFLPKTPVGAGLVPALFRGGSAKGNPGLWETGAGLALPLRIAHSGTFEPKQKMLDSLAFSAHRFKQKILKTTLVQRIKISVLGKFCPKR
jgi:hypothetical protein